MDHTRSTRSHRCVDFFTFVNIVVNILFTIDDPGFCSGLRWLHTEHAINVSYDERGDSKKLDQRTKPMAKGTADIRE